MNARKSAKTVGATIDRMLRSGAMLKSPPPAFYPLLSHPPPPSLVRFNPARPATDLPATTTIPDTPYRAARAKLDAGIRLNEVEKLLLEAPQPASITRRKPPRKANSTRSRPMPIVFQDDEIRRQFFRDHPFEAYRPVFLAEGETVQAPSGPQGVEWTELRQKTIIPTAEDAITFIHNLHSSHSIPLATAYTHGVSQFRTLRAEHETATRSATLEARAHGAIFFGEIERGLQVEEKVLDEWVNGRAIQDAIAASKGGAGAAPISIASAEGIWARQADEHVPEDVQGEIEFTGGLKYVERFQTRGLEEQLGAEEVEGLEQQP